jgi:RNA polymerase sigma-70 factor (ECF subfamily)
VKPHHEMYQRLIEPVEERMIAIVTRIMRDHHDSMDVFQEILAVIWKKLPTIDRHPNPQAYILRICVSRCYDALRKKARRRREVRLNKEAEYLQQQSSVEDPELFSTIRESIALLPAKQAKAVFLRLIEGENYPDIAGILGCSAATARSHFSKGKANLRTILTDLGLSPERNVK